MQVHANAGDYCTVGLIGDGGPVVAASTIEKSVGIGGANLRSDVLAIQKLLNRIAPEDGGPAIMLGEDGWIGEKTNRAIHDFQRFHKTGTDTRVDPNGPTLAKMNAVAGGRNPASVRADRLLRTAAKMPELRALARTSLHTAELALDHLLRGGPDFAGSDRPHKLAQFHFALDRVVKPKQIAALKFIITTFRRVNTVLFDRPSPSTGGNPFGLAVFEINPLGKPWVAYSPTQRNDRPGRKDHSGEIYLCDRADALHDDKFLRVLLHELLHFVDDETQSHVITDYAYADRCFQLPHELRMRNSDSYALFGSHAYFGHQRLVASAPRLAGKLPDL